jgi:hypothetical protein
VLSCSRGGEVLETSSLTHTGEILPDGWRCNIRRWLRRFAKGEAYILGGLRTNQGNSGWKRLSGAPKVTGTVVEFD